MYPRTPPRVPGNRDAASREDRSAGRAGLHYASALEVAGRRWRVDYAMTREYLEAHRSWQGWGVLAAGMAFTGLLGAYILSLLGRSAIVERLVALRTEELATTNMELEASRREQLKLKDEFLSHVSHELRSPLASTHQFVGIVLDGIAGTINAEQRQYLEIAQKSANQLRSMIDELLDTARLQTGKLTVEPRRMSVPHVIRETVQSLAQSASTQGSNLSTETDPDLPAVYADPGRVRQVLTNLIENAVKFTPAPGKITVRARLDGGDPGFLLVSVVDTGCGLAAEELERIFEHLYQVKGAQTTSRKGLGLGLYICKDLVTRQGGRIWVASEGGRGSTFSFTLPVFSLAPTLAPILASSNLDKASAALLCIDLRRAGSGAASGSGDDLIAEIRATIERCLLPDLDVLLPRMSGKGCTESCFVVALADAEGAKVLSRRIAGQLVSGAAARKWDLEWAISVSVLDSWGRTQGGSVEDRRNLLIGEIEGRVEFSTMEEAA